MIWHFSSYKWWFGILKPILFLCEIKYQKFVVELKCVVMFWMLLMCSFYDTILPFVWLYKNVQPSSSTFYFFVFAHCAAFPYIAKGWASFFCKQETEDRILHSRLIKNCLIYHIRHVFTIIMFLLFMMIGLFGVERSACANNGTYD